MLLYLRAWSIIKRKQFLNLFPKENSFTKFAIICSPRSGSTWLHTLLNSHTQIVSYGEIMRKTLEENPKHPLPSPKELVFHHHHTSIQAVGLKIFYEYSTEEPFKKSFQEIANDHSIHIIHLIRKDKERQFISLKRAQVTQQWSSGKKIHDLPPVAIDPNELEEYKNQLHQQELQMEKLFQQHPVLTFTYEDLRDQPELRCMEIQKFLQVTPRELFSVLRPQS